MSGRNHHLSTTERVIKGAGRAGPSSSPGGKQPLAGETAGGGGRRGTRAASVRGEDREGV